MRCRAGPANAQIADVKSGKMRGGQDHTYGSWSLNSRSKMGVGLGGAQPPPGSKLLCGVGQVAELFKITRAATES